MREIVCTSLRRVYFRCPTCGFAAWKAYKIGNEWTSNEFVCPNCRAIARVRHAVLLDLILGFIIAGYVLAISHWLDGHLPEDASPFVSLLAAVTLALALAVPTSLLYSRLVYRWVIARQGAASQ
jgi:predicted RNA-binding Zn-ribbon protein involved in translation (DUF1610 family)